MLSVSERRNARATARFLILAVGLGTFAFAGCERKERVVDIETPGVDVEVNRNVDTGEVEVESERK